MDTFTNPRQITTPQFSTLNSQTSGTKLNQIHQTQGRIHHWYPRKPFHDISAQQSASGKGGQTQGKWYDDFLSETE